MKHLDGVEKSSKNAIERKAWLLFKKLKRGADGGFTYVESHKANGYTWIRWEATLYCPKNEVRIAGPEIKNPEPALLEKLKNGDLGMPEPERTIFESIRCTK